MHSFFEAEEVLLAAPIAQHFGRGAVPEEAIQVSTHVGSDKARIGFDHLPEQLPVRVRQTIIDAARTEIVLEPGIEECVYRGFLRNARDLFGVFLFELLYPWLFNVFKHVTLAAVPIRGFL